MLWGHSMWNHQGQKTSCFASLFKFIQEVDLYESILNPKFQVARWSVGWDMARGTFSQNGPIRNPPKRKKVIIFLLSNTQGSVRAHFKVNFESILIRPLIQSSLIHGVRYLIKTIFFFMASQPISTSPPTVNFCFKLLPRMCVIVFRKSRMGPLWVY